MMMLGKTKIHSFVLLLIVSVWSAYAESEQPQRPCNGTDYEAVLVVESLWNRASAGDLLTPQGWTDASSAAFFTESSSSRRETDFLVVDNRYWITNISREGDKLLVPVETSELGRIDSELRFTPIRHENPDFHAYRLVYGPTPNGMWTSDGKKLLKQTVTMTGPTRWRIEGPLTYRWTTINTAIRYVMDARDRSSDPVVKANAERTLAALRKHR